MKKWFFSQLHILAALTVMISAVVLCGCGAGRSGGGSAVVSPDTVQVVLEDSDAFQADAAVRRVARGGDVSFVLEPASGMKPVSCDYEDYSLTQSGLSSGYQLTLHHVRYDTAVSIQSENAGYPLTAYWNDGSGRSFIFYTNPAHRRQNTPAADGIEREGYTLTGWSTDPAGHGDVASPGSRLSLSGKTTGSGTAADDVAACVYAVWEPWTDPDLFQTEAVGDGIKITGVKDRVLKTSDSGVADPAANVSYAGVDNPAGNASDADMDNPAMDTSGSRNTASSASGQSQQIQDCLCVPSIIDGKSVTIIGTGAFRDLHCRKVVLPPSILTIEEEAFAGADIEELLLFDSLDSVSDLSFKNCTGLKTLHIGAATAPRYSGTYYDTFPDKMDYLMDMHAQCKDAGTARSSDVSRSHLLVLFSGSSTRFGYDSTALEAAFPDYHVCNMGVFAYTNALPQLDLIQLYMEKGDILLDSPEFDAAKRQFCTTNALDDKFFNMIEADYDLLSRLDLGDYSSVFTAFHQYLSIRRSLPEQSYTIWAGDYDEDGNPLDATAVSSSVNADTNAAATLSPYNRDHSNAKLEHQASYNEHGDYIVYRPNADSDDPVYGLPVDYTKKSFPADLYFVPANKEFRKFTQRGIRVFLTYAPRNSKALSEESTPDAIDELDDWIRENIEVPVISTLSDSLYQGRYLYGTDNHLSTEGVQIRTRRIIRDLRAALG